jgi:ectoine hydroxylase-related dioxygenase (phytanoyl-CoA dioxygenase family)
VRLYRAILMAKAAREAERPGGTPLPWHQDAGTLWGLDREPELQLWTALDPAPEEAGCLAVLPQSHLGGLATPLGGMVPAKLVEAARADDRAVLVPAQPGDVVLLHNLAWHASGTNHTPHPRRAFSACFLHDDTRCTRRKRAPREFWQVFGRDEVPPS